MSSPVEFFKALGALKTTKRTGWVRAGVALPESIADHMYRMAALALLVEDAKINRDKLIKMALVHDLAEAVVGDITPYDGVPKEEKHAREVKGLQTIIAGLPSHIGKEIFDLFMDYETGTSVEAIQLKDFDKFEMILQASEYEKAQGKSLEDFFRSTDGKFKTAQVLGWEKQLREARASSIPPGLHRPTKRVLLLGSGRVAAPVVDYMLRSQDNFLLVASAELDQAKDLIRKYPAARAAATHLDVTDASSLDGLVQDKDLVISLVPAVFHARVVSSCIKFKKSVVTASYISPELRALEEQVKAAGILVLNEMGLDPGIDHMSALEIIHGVQAKGGKLLSFRSVCGGLPAPEAANNPLGYKFSWYPKGVLLACLNAAKYRENGKTVEVPGDRLLTTTSHLELAPCFSFEVLPNRDSLSYCTSYGLEDVQTMFRGTLRYKGYAEVMSSLYQLGLFDTKPTELLAATPPPISWPNLLRKLLAIADSAPLEPAIVAKLKLAEAADRHRAARALGALRWLGMLDAASAVPLKGSPIDSLCALLESRLTFGRDERDMVVLSHEFLIAWPDKQEQRTSTLIAYGEKDGYSAMAKTVGLPLAISAQMILDGRLKRVGVLAPFTADIYAPVMAALHAEGVSFSESSIFL
jgi:saccharopine dehydrogenase-like NADP-dependent oxidoreductase/5'-deoxynucleotidase YfbR-like HD superfamily hydrolase